MGPSGLTRATLSPMLSPIARPLASRANLFMRVVHLLESIPRGLVALIRRAGGWAHSRVAGIGLAPLCPKRSTKEVAHGTQHRFDAGLGALRLVHPRAR